MRWDALNDNGVLVRARKTLLRKPRAMRESRGAHRKSERKRSTRQERRRVKKDVTGE